MPSEAGSTKNKPAAFGGWKAAFGCTYEALALFRITLGCLLTLELALRYRYLKPFYSDDGTLPLRLLLPNVDDLYKTVCLHCRFGHLWQQQILLSVQLGLAMLYTAGVPWTAIPCWYLYLSSTLRNTWMSYILDRYFHYLLFYSIFLPLNERWTFFSKKSPKRHGIVISPASVVLKLLVTWIYIDASFGKLRDPLGGWTYSADPLPALDTYARHTVLARYMYALIGPPGLRLLTPVVVYVELLAVPVSLAGSYLGNRKLVLTAIGFVCALHTGIALMLRNAALLSFVACSVWMVFLPVGWNQAFSTTGTPSNNVHRNRSVRESCGFLLSILLITSMVAGSLWLDRHSRACDQSVKHIWSTLLHNRWNVFVGAEEYVTWEIAPGMLEDGSVVDVWGKKENVDWNLPGSGAPCTSTNRAGRWRSFPYLAEFKGEDADALWGYLCKEWDEENDVDRYPGRKLFRFNFFMLQADVLPNMGFSETRKRLIQSYECPSVVRETSAEANESEGSASSEL